MTHQDYDAKKVQLEKGDTLFLYTDGVTEAMDSEMNMYEDERLASYLKKASGSSVQDLAKGSITDLKSFVGSAPQSDDITVMTLRYLGRNGA